MLLVFVAQMSHTGMLGSYRLKSRVPTFNAILINVLLTGAPPHRG